MQRFRGWGGLGICFLLLAAGSQALEAAQAKPGDKKEAAPEKKGAEAKHEHKRPSEFAGRRRGGAPHAGRHRPGWARGYGSWGYWGRGPAWGRRPAWGHWYRRHAWRRGGYGPAWGHRPGYHRWGWQPPPGGPGRWGAFPWGPRPGGPPAWGPWGRSWTPPFPGGPRGRPGGPGSPPPFPGGPGPWAGPAPLGFFPGLKLTDEQKKKVAELQKKMHEEFLKILTPEQRQQLEKMKKGPRAKDQGPPRKEGKSPQKTTAWQELRNGGQSLERQLVTLWTALRSLPAIWGRETSSLPGTSAGRGRETPLP
jgi:hypothetical protein